MNICWKSSCVWSGLRIYLSKYGRILVVCRAKPLVQSRAVGLFATFSNNIINSYDLFTPKSRIMNSLVLTWHLCLVCCLGHCVGVPRISEVLSVFEVICCWRQSISFQLRANMMVVTFHQRTNVAQAKHSHLLIDFLMSCNTKACVWKSGLLCKGNPNPPTEMYGTSQMVCM